MTLLEDPQTVDALVSAASMAGAFVCVYLIQVTVHEKTSGIHLQRIALGFLGFSLFANSVSDFGMVGAHRITGIFIVFAVLFLLVVQAIRGRLSINNWESPRSRFDSWRLWN